MINIILEMTCGMDAWRQQDFTAPGRRNLPSRTQAPLLLDKPGRFNMRRIVLRFWMDLVSVAITPSLRTSGMLTPTATLAHKLQRTLLYGWG